MNMENELAKMILTLRKERGWSMAELGRRTIMSPTTIGLIESGRLVPYRSQVEKIASAFESSNSQRDLLLRLHNTWEKERLDQWR